MRLPSAVSCFTLENEVGLADGVGFRVDLLAIQMDRNLLAVFGGESGERLLSDGQHAAGAAGAVVHEIGTRFDLVGNRYENQPRHEPYDVTWGEVLAGFLVVLLVETADQFFEHSAHSVVVKRLQTHGSVSVQHRFWLRLIEGSRNFSRRNPSKSFSTNSGI